MATPVPKPATPSSAWEAALDVWLVGMEPSESDGAPVGLQFEVRPTSLWVRLVAPGKAGWVRTNISWQHVQFGWTKTSVSPHVGQLLEEILSLASRSPGAYLGYGHEAIIDLVEVRSRRIWDLLAEAHEAGMPFAGGQRAGLGADRPRARQGDHGNARPNSSAAWSTTGSSPMLASPPQTSALCWTSG